MILYASTNRKVCWEDYPAFTTLRRKYSLRYLVQSTIPRDIALGHLSQPTSHRDITSATSSHTAYLTRDLPSGTYNRLLYIEISPHGTYHSLPYIEIQPPGSYHSVLYIEFQPQVSNTAYFPQRYHFRHLSQPTLHRDIASGTYQAYVTQKYGLKHPSQLTSHSDTTPHFSLSRDHPVRHMALDLSYICPRLPLQLLNLLVCGITPQINCLHLVFPSVRNSFWIHRSWPPSHFSM